MASNLRTPGVYIEEVTRFPPSVVPVETAIPVFIGSTERTGSGGLDLINRPVEIDSFLEFEQIFGQAPAVGGFAVDLDPDGQVIGTVADPNLGASARFRTANALRHFYDNGGGRCYVVSIGDYAASGVASNVVAAHVAGLAAIARQDEPTLLVLPDLSGLAPAAPGGAAEIAAARASYHSVLTQALDQCATLGDRFLIAEVWGGDQAGSAAIDAFRDGIGTRNLKYAAVYHPFIHTTLPWRWNEATITLAQVASRNADGSLTRLGVQNGRTLTQALAAGATSVYAAVRQALDRYSVVLPPGAAVAGVYATVDRTRGVWKSPANESLASVRALTVAVDNDLNDHMNVAPHRQSDQRPALLHRQGQPGVGRPHSRRQRQRVALCLGPPLLQHGRGVDPARPPSRSSSSPTTPTPGCR